MEFVALNLDICNFRIDSAFVIKILHCGDCQPLRNGIDATINQLILHSKRALSAAILHQQILFWSGVLRVIIENQFTF